MRPSGTMPSSLGFQALTPSFLMHKAAAGLTPKETHALARLIAKVDKRDVSPEQSRPAFFLAQNVLRHLLAIAAAVEAASHVAAPPVESADDPDGGPGAAELGATVTQADVERYLVSSSNAGPPVLPSSPVRTRLAATEDELRAAKEELTMLRAVLARRDAASTSEPPGKMRGSDGNNGEGVYSVVRQLSAPEASFGLTAQLTTPGGDGDERYLGTKRDDAPSEADALSFRAKCMRTIQDVVAVNRGLEERLRKEHERRNKAEDDAAGLRKALGLGVVAGGGARLTKGNVGGGRLDDLGVLREMNRAAAVIQRRHRGIMGRRQVRDYCSKVMAGEDDAHDAPCVTAPPKLKRDARGGHGAPRGSGNEENQGGSTTMAEMRRRINEMNATLRVVESRHRRELNEARTEVISLREANAALLDTNQQLATLSATRAALERERMARQEAQRALRAALVERGEGGGGGADELTPVERAGFHVADEHDPSVRWVQRDAP